MKRNQILIVVLMIAASVLPVHAAENSFFDNIGLSLGIYRQEINATELQNVNINTEFQINSKYDIPNVKWLLDGVEVRNDNNVRKSVYRVSTTDLNKLKQGKNIIEYKAGRDPQTKKMRHKVTASYDGGVYSWTISER